MRILHTLPENERPTWVEINLENLIHNFRLMADFVGPEVAVMPAVKADAYGHGAVECVRALQSAGAQWFGVALPEEAYALREAGITESILCLGSFWEGQEHDIIAKKLTPAIFRIDLLERLNRAAREMKTSVDYHLKVDTGMGRLGVRMNSLDEFLAQAEQLKHVSLAGVMSHMAAADHEDKEEFTRGQMARFEEALRIVRKRGHQPKWIHQANGAAAHAYPESRGNLVRLGGVTYGLWRDVTNSNAAPLDWRPVLSLKTRVELLKTVGKGEAIGYGGTFVTERESLIATLPIGYHDGLPRSLSNKGEVLIRGIRAPMVGRISMDLTLIDVTDVAEVETGDDVIIIGEGITAEEVGKRSGTISYEVSCGISERVPRVVKIGARR